MGNVLQSGEIAHKRVHYDDYHLQSAQACRRGDNRPGLVQDSSRSQLRLVPSQSYRCCCCSRSKRVDDLRALVLQVAGSGRKNHQQAPAPLT